MTIKKLKHVGMVCAVSALLVGCAGIDGNVARFEADVQKITVGEPFAISARDLAAVMLQAGFTGEEVLEYGPKVRSAIGMSGGAQNTKDRYARAILTVLEGKLYVSSRDFGTFLREL